MSTCDHLNNKQNKHKILKNQNPRISLKFHFGFIWKRKIVDSQLENPLIMWV